MDKVIGKTPKIGTLREIAKQAPAEAVDRNYHMLWRLMELDRIAVKYLFDSVSICMREIIATYAYSHAPMALAFACQQTPPHGTIARSALEAFENGMPCWMDEYFKECEPVDDESDSGSTESSFSPAIHNLTKSFAKDLGAEALLAYAVALNKASILDDGMAWDESPHHAEERAKGGRWDWERVAKEFFREMDIKGRGTVFMEGPDSDTDECMDDLDMLLGSPEL
jgi:hypothetical protein